MKPSRQLLLIAIFLLACASSACGQFDPFAREYGKLEVDEQSDYSHIQVRANGSYRTLFFVRDNGEAVIESKLNLKQPYRLELDYTKSMFLSYAFVPQPKRVLIVGLGGGSMVHFLKKYDPELTVDVLDIDPAIVRIADKYFGVRSEGKIDVITADGIKYIAETKNEYDVIYMDAFLKPSGKTDVNGVPLELKTGDFFKLMQKKLSPGGVVVFNLNPHAGTADDVGEISSAFGQTYVFRLADSKGLVAVATTAREREQPATLAKRARELDARFRAPMSFSTMVQKLIKPMK
jgi:spermidine synthase